MTIHLLHLKVLVITGCNQSKPITTEVWLQLVATGCDQLQLQLLTIALSCNRLQLQLLQIWFTTATQLDLETLAKVTFLYAGRGLGYDCLGKGLGGTMFSFADFLAPERPAVGFRFVAIFDFP